MISSKKREKNVFADNPMLRTGLILTGIVLAMTIIGCFYTPYDPTAMDASNKLSGISAAHIMGTDQLGRDVFSRVLYGSRITLLIALGTIAIGAGAGTLIGAFTGYFGGIPDEIIMRVIDAMFAFPSILMALVFVSLFQTGTWQLILSLGIAFIPSFARIVRSEFIRCRGMDYVTLAKLQGVNDLRIMFVHILPNITGVLMSSVLIGFNNAVLAEAGLSFLGIGSQPPYSSLGRMLSDAQGYLFSCPSVILCIGSVIVLMNLGFAFLGEGIKRRNG